MSKTKLPRTRLSLHQLEERLAPAVFQVTAIGDTGAGTLRDAIGLANAAAGVDSITFSSLFNTPQTIALTSGELLVSDAVSITGPGANLLTVQRDAGAATAFRIFRADVPGVGASVGISGMRIAGGNQTGTSGGGTSGDGGALLMFNDNITLDSVIVTGNSATEGGAVAVASPSGGGTSGGSGFLTIRNSTVSGNTSNGTPGTGFGGAGGAVYFANGGSLLIQNSTLSGNTSTNSQGGAVYFYGVIGAGGCAILNSTISGNTSATNAGGLYIGTITGNALVQNSTIANNTANGATNSGGGLGRFGGGAGVLSVVSSIVANNTIAAGGTGPDVRGNITASFSLIRDQSGATITDGGNNLAAGTDPLFNAAGLASNGGPTQTIALQPASPAVNAGTNPSGFQFDQRGAGFPRSVGPADIGAYEFLPPGTPTGSATLTNVTSAVNGPLYTFTITFTDDTAINVSTIGNGDARVTGPLGYNQLATFVSVNPNMNGTPLTATYTVPAPGGSFEFAENGSYQVSIEPSQIADTSGNFVPAGALALFQVLIVGNYTVTNTDDSGPGSLREGLALDRDFNTVDAILFGPQFNTAQTISLSTGELFIGNPVTIIGPGASLLTIQRLNGAATFFRVFNVNAPGVANVSISGMTITGGNTVGTSGSGTGGDGAGLLMFNDNVTLDGVAITGNASSTEGGGVAVASINGGGAGSLTIRNSTISGNSANGLLSGTFGGSGGGIYFANGGSLQVENSTISGNTSVNGHGGGVYFYGTVGTGGWGIVNSTITGNSAARNGGGVYLYGVEADMRVRNSTITANTTVQAGGGLFFSATSGLAIESTVISDNTGATAPDVSGIATVGFSLIRDQTGATITESGPNVAAGTNPLFAAAGLANNGGPTQTIALQTGSPLLNVGSNPATLAFDQRGPNFLRSSGTGVDIGAFEVQVPTAPAVATTSVNDGATQRSKVTSIAVTFTQQVTFAGAVGNAFTLTRTGGGSVGFNASAAVVGGRTVVTLDGFTGAETENGSLRDGRYTLTAIATQITAGGLQLNNGTNFTFGDAQGLFRFYGDINADRRVDISDFGFFSAAFLQGPAANNPALDFNNDGRIDISDFGQFSVRYFTTLP